MPRLGECGGPRIRRAAFPDGPPTYPRWYRAGGEEHHFKGWSLLLAHLEDERVGVAADGGLVHQFDAGRGDAELARELRQHHVLRDEHPRRVFVVEARHRLAVLAEDVPGVGHLLREPRVV